MLLRCMEFACLDMEAEGVWLARYVLKHYVHAQRKLQCHYYTTYMYMKLSVILPIQLFHHSKYRLPLAEIATYKTSRHSYIFPEAVYCAPKSFTFMEV